jgi:hypothetical protein
VVLVHLTTTAVIGASAAKAAESLSKAISMLCKSSSAKEMWHVSFGLPISDSGVKMTSADGSMVQGSLVIGRLPYTCDPYPIIQQSQSAFEAIFEGVSYFVQSDEEREAAARARGEGDEEAMALDHAFRDDEQREAELANQLSLLSSRIDALEQQDFIANQRISNIEVVFKYQ